MFLQQLENPYEVEEGEEKTDCSQLISILKIKQTLIMEEDSETMTCSRFHRGGERARERERVHNHEEKQNPSCISAK
jgi:hypothetical protein